MRNVAAALAGNENFRTAARVLFQKHHPGSLACGKSGGEQSRRPAADYNHIVSLHVASITSIKYKVTNNQNPSLAVCRTIHEPAANPAVWPIFQLLFGP
jgi:hypothetical protein